MYTGRASGIVVASFGSNDANPEPPIPKTESFNGV